MELAFHKIIIGNQKRSGLHDMHISSCCLYSLKPREMTSRIHLSERPKKWRFVEHSKLNISKVQMTVCLLHESKSCQRYLQSKKSHRDLIIMLMAGTAVALLHSPTVIGTQIMVWYAFNHAKGRLILEICLLICTWDSLANALGMAFKMLLASSSCRSLTSELSSFASNAAERTWISNTFEAVNKEATWTEQSKIL